MILRFALFLGLSLAFVTSSHAGVVAVGQQFEDSIPDPQNNFVDDLNGLGLTTIWKGGFTFGSDGVIDFYYHGAESGFLNRLEYHNGSDWVTLFDENVVGPFNGNNDPWALDAVVRNSISVSAGETLRLAFNANNGPAPTRHELGTDEFGIFASNDGTYLVDVSDETGVLDDLRVFFGHDDNGASKDDNHDDMIVSARFRGFEPFTGRFVPEPGSFAVWGVLGLVGLAGGRRRRG